MTVQNTKRQLRRQMRQLRQRIPEERWSADCRHIADHLIELECIYGARLVALFWPMLERREVDLRPVLHELWRGGAGVALPFISDGQEGFVRVDSLDALETHPLGFRQPRSGSPISAPDVVVVPALAVDAEGYRLGYGAGFYDRALSRLDATSVAVVFECQILAEVPTEPHDRPCQWLVSEHGAVEVGAASSSG